MTAVDRSSRDLIHLTAVPAAAAAADTARTGHRGGVGGGHGSSVQRSVLGAWAGTAAAAAADLKWNAPGERPDYWSGANTTARVTGGM